MTPIIIYNDDHIYENLIHAGLSPQEATVYIEVEMDGNSIISTADQIEVSPQAVSNALRKAKNKIALYKIEVSSLS